MCGDRAFTVTPWPVWPVQSAQAAQQLEWRTFLSDKFIARTPGATVYRALAALGAIRAEKRAATALFRLPHGLWDPCGVRKQLSSSNGALCSVPIFLRQAIRIPVYTVARRA